MPLIFSIHPTESPVQPVRLKLRAESAGHRICLHIVVPDDLAAIETPITAHLLCRLLKHALAVTVAMQIRESSAHGRACINSLLDPLHHYADRITVEANRSLPSWLGSPILRITAVTEQ